MDTNYVISLTVASLLGYAWGAFVGYKLGRRDQREIDKRDK